MPNPAAAWGRESIIDEGPTGFVNRRLRQLLYLCCLLLLTCYSHSQTEVAAQKENLSLLSDAAQSIAAGNLNRAESDLQTLLRKAPKDVRGINLLGIVRAQQHREPQAEQLFKQAIEIQPDFAGAHASLGLLYVQMARPDDAIPQLKEALRLDPGRADASRALAEIWRTQARAAVQKGDPEKALSLLIEARKADPNNADVLFDFGMVALRMSLLPDAVQAFRETLNLRKDDGDALYGLGRAQIGLDKYEDARESFSRYIQLHPEEASGHFALGMTLQALQRSDEARKEYETSIQLRPEQSASYFQLGLMDLDAGDLKPASEHCGRVLQQDPRHTGALVCVGRISFQEKEYAKAAEWLQSAIAIDSSLREAHYYLGLTYARIGRTADSEKELQIASQLEKEDLQKHRTVFKILDPAQTDNPENH